MTVAVRYNKSHHAGPDANARVKPPSQQRCWRKSKHAVQKGDGPTRTHTNIHHAGHYVQPGTAAQPTSGLVTKRGSDVGGGNVE
jgi:hypothetical protein